VLTIVLLSWSDKPVPCCLREITLNLSAVSVTSVGVAPDLKGSSDSMRAVFTGAVTCCTPKRRGGLGLGDEKTQLGALGTLRSSLNT
jgi:hypothetical protein